MKNPLKQAFTRGLGVLLIAQTSYALAATTAREGVEFSIRWDSVNSLYRVYMRPNATPSPDVSTTAQVTIVAPYGDSTNLFVPSSITNLHDGVTWSTSSKVYAPSENPTKAYLSFTAKIDLPTSFQWKAGVEQEVFNFKNGTKCLEAVELINNDTDPFNQPGGNSRNTNPGNQFSNTYWGDVNDNDYIGNYAAASAADCSLSIDTDGDGLTDGVEINTTKTDPTIADTDGDGLTDGVEVNTSKTDPLKADTDGDSLKDGVEVNTSKTDPLKADTDADGLADNIELATTKTDPLKADTDGDTLSDGQEVNTSKTDPLKVDTDADGLNDNLELATYKTDPLKADTDGDSLTDGFEVSTSKTDPLKTDTDGDALSDSTELSTTKTNPLKLDTDGDALSDGAEVLTTKTNPLKSDTDGDGLADNVEVTTTKTDPLKTDSDGDGVPDGVEVGADPLKPLDTDGDGKINALDTDDDGDGLLTTSENYNGGTPTDDDTDKDGKPDYLDTDDDGDGVISANEGNDPNKNDLPEDALDTDQDGIPDYLDATMDSISLQMRVMLQGAFSSSTLLMRDDLRAKGLIPTKQPYTSAPYNYSGTETTNTTQLALTGNNAPVDWVLIELRSSANSKTVLQRKAALVQRDGDVVDASTGSTSLTFLGAAVGNYYVAVRHRNHLGVMTASTLSLKASPSLVDFTLATTSTYGISSGRAVSKGISLLWAGDANMDSNLISNGVGQDTGPIYALVLTDPGNILFSSNYVVNGYHTTDFTMDGQTIFTGPNNDVNLLSSNVLANPGNLSYNANYIVRAQLP